MKECDRMKKLKSKILQAALTVVLGCTLMLPTLAAPTVDDAKDIKADLESQLEEIEAQAAALKEQAASTQEYLDKLDGQLAELSNQLISVEQELSATEEELANTQIALEEAKVTKDKQYEDMKKRIKFMYENGDTAYLEMILEAKDFTDMLNKADYVKAISEYDRDMLNEFQNTVADIAAKETQIKEKHAEIQALKISVEEQKASVETLTETKTAEMEKYSEEIAASEELQEQYEAEIEAQDRLIAQLEAEALRKAEEEARKKAEADRKAQSSGNTSNGSGSGDASSSTASKSGWTWPLPGQRRITSDYGYRPHPTLGYNKFHNGIDIGAPTGTPIVAANSGTVIAAAYNNTMGNYVMIDHGGGVISIYMHCSALNTSAGSTVRSGQTIAYVGSTGRSTGPHLHFGVRVNGEYVSPWNYVS